MKTKIALMTLAISSALLMSACHDDDDDHKTNSNNGDSNSTNNAPELVVTAKQIPIANALKDVVIIESTGTDQDGDTLTYSITNTSEGYYAIDADSGVVTLTQKGEDFVKAGNTLPEIEISVTDGKDTVSKNVTPVIQQNTTPVEGNKLTTFIANDARFSTLSAALSAVPGENQATLGKDIEQLDDITILAPTNDAIDKTLDILVTQMPDLDTDSSGKIEVAELVAQPDLLKSILQYHVITNKVESSQVASNLNKNLPTLNNLPLFITQNGADIFVPSQAIQLANATANSSNQTMQAKIDLQNIDIQIDNGVIHVIDQALIPPMYNIDETLAKLPDTSKLREFMVLVGDSSGSVASVATEQDATSYTVLAPNNAAINQKCVDLNPAAGSYTGGVPIIDSNNECVLTPLESFGPAVNSFIPIPNNIKSGTLFSGEVGTIEGNVVGPNYIAKNGVVHITDSLQ